MSDVVIVPDAPSAVLVRDGTAAVVYMDNLGAPSAAAAAASAIAAQAARDAALAAQAAAEAQVALAEVQVGLAEDQVALAVAQVALATAQKVLAAAQAAASANSATLSAEYRDASLAAKLLSETAAGASGAYLDAIEVLTGGAAISGTLTMQAATRAILTAITGMSAGAQVYLGEAGYSGPFIFVGGDQGAAITADPYHALWLAPDSDTTGASGAWKRVHYGLAQASWAGVIASGIGNYAAQFNSLLGHADVWAVELPSGTIGVTGPILVTSGKLLFGKGIGSTILKATAATGYTAGAGVFQNAIVNLVSGSIGTRARDFTVDANKFGSHTIGGVHQIQSKQAVVERVYAKNCSAYAFWAVTNFVYALDTTSGVFRDCWADNCNVSFETTAAQNILFERCHARDGDADISPNIETMFHPITGSKKITYRDCTGITANAGTVVHCAAYTAEDMEDILFENCYFKATNGAVACGVDAYLAAIRRLRFVDCYIESTDYFGINATDADAGGPYGIDISVEGGTIKALAQGIVSDSTIGRLQVSRTRFVMRHTSGAGEVGYVTANGEMILDGPTFDTDRAFAYPQALPQNAKIIAPPIVEVATAYPPMGIGHKVTRVLTADEDHNGGAALVGSGMTSFNMTTTIEGTYAVHVQGAYSAGTLTNSIALQVESTANLVHGSGEIHGHADGTLVKHGRFEGATSAFGSGDGVSVIDTPFPFKADFTVYFDSDGGNFSFNVGPYINDGAGFGGTSSIKTGTMMTIERIA